MGVTLREPLGEADTLIVDARRRQILLNGRNARQYVDVVNDRWPVVNPGAVRLALRGTATSGQVGVYVTRLW